VAENSTTFELENLGIDIAISSGNIWMIEINQYPFAPHDLGAAAEKEID
jgi:hypothetical protein